MSACLTINSFNMGASIGNYLQLCQHKDNNFHILDPEQKAFQAKYEAVQNKAAELLCGTSDVYCLQEVGDMSRPIINKLQNSQYTIIHLHGAEKFGTAIALRQAEFYDITNQSFEVELAPNEKYDVAVASATHSTGKRMTFISMHVPGFPFEDVSEPESRPGDLYTRAVATKLSQIAKGRLQVIGADMNANPAIYHQAGVKFENRFSHLAHQGFQTCGIGYHTNVNPRSTPLYQQREIDFIFVNRPSLLQRIRSIFCSFTDISVGITNKYSNWWNPEVNCSDHIPVNATLRFNTRPSQIAQLWNKLISLFTRPNPKPVV